MVRKSAEFSLGSNGTSKKSNGHSIDDHPNEMDLDESGFLDKMETEENFASTTGDEATLLAETIAYGQQLQEEFKGDRPREVSKALGDVFSLLAYPNPFEVPEVAHLLDRRGRAAVAEELNSAILRKSRVTTCSPFEAHFLHYFCSICGKVISLSFREPLWTNKRLIGLPAGERRPWLICHNTVGG
jgi:hypothetical protein